MTVLIYSGQPAQGLATKLHSLQGFENETVVCVHTPAQGLEKAKAISAALRLVLIECSAPGLYLLRQIRSVVLPHASAPVFVLVPSECCLDPYLDEFFSAGAVDLLSEATPVQLIQSRIGAVVDISSPAKPHLPVQTRPRSFSSVQRPGRRGEVSALQDQSELPAVSDTPPARRRTSLTGNPHAINRDHDNTLSAVESILLQISQQELSCERVRERLEILAQNIRSEISNLSADGFIHGDIRDDSYQQVYDLPVDDYKAAARFTQTSSRIATQLSHESESSSLLSFEGETTPIVLLGEMKEMTFDVWKYSHRDLLTVSFEIFKDLGLVEKFRINPDHLRSFLYAIEASYRPWNPYHNFRHAVDVLMNVYYFLTNSDLKEYILPIDMLALSLAAICHDIDHPGCSNAFEINTHSAKANRYNDISVLENHHSSFTFLLLRHPHFNILSGLSMEEFKEIRRVVIQAILATDMAFHFDALAKFVQKLDSEDGYSKPSAKEDRQVIINVILHFADICNGCKPWEPHKKWQDVLMQEFFIQGDKERKLGLPISNFCDRSNPDQIKLAINFMDHFVTPLYSNLSRFLPDITETCGGNLLSNREAWVEKKMQAEKGQRRSTRHEVKQPAAHPSSRPF